MIKQADLMYKKADKKYIFERLVYTPPDLSLRFTCKVNLSNTNLFSKYKKSGLNCFILAFSLDRGMQRVNWLQPRTIVCCIKLCFGDVQLSPLSLQRSGWGGKKLTL